MAERRVSDRGRVEIDAELCKGCELCVAACPVGVLQLSDALNRRGYFPARCAAAGCTGCGICFYVCPEPGTITVLVLEPEAGADAPARPRAEARAYEAAVRRVGVPASDRAGCRAEPDFKTSGGARL